MGITDFGHVIGSRSGVGLLLGLKLVQLHCVEISRWWNANPHLLPSIREEIVDDELPIYSMLVVELCIIKQFQIKSYKSYNEMLPTLILRSKRTNKSRLLSS